MKKDSPLAKKKTMNPIEEESKDYVNLTESDNHCRHILHRKCNCLLKKLINNKEKLESHLDLGRIKVMVEVSSFLADKINHISKNFSKIFSYYIFKSEITISW